MVITCLGGPALLKVFSADSAVNFILRFLSMECGSLGKVKETRRGVC